MALTLFNLPTLTALQLWERVIGYTKNGIIIVDAQKQDLPIIHVNTAFEQKTGYSLAEVKGKNPRFLHKDDTGQLGLAEIRQAISQEKYCNVVLRNYHKNGTLFWNEILIAPFFDSTGKLTHYIGIQNYITARKMAEDEVIKLNAELEQRVSERTAQLEEANRVLTEQISRREQLEVELRNSLEKEQELGKLKSRFISMTSHEFRTPLSVILSYSELLEYYGETWTQEKRKTSLQNIQREVVHMTNILNDILTVGKAEAGVLEFNPLPQNLGSICTEVINEVGHSCGNISQIHFENNIEPVLIMLDEKLIRQILINLLTNAIKYSADGSPVILNLSKKLGNIIIEVKDQGIGIPQSDQNHIFEPFHRATNVTGIAGTGLGLAIVKKSVELHGGEIQFFSNPQEGTTFKVTFPLKPFNGTIQGEISNIYAG